ncbi:MAG: bacteriohopanetetrol glucosamine biosynthesis glycosyltransferase HpnI [Trichlorobacter sp.]|uniref:bacteriohopanetetrol glucosamine biosynthesis glycosyltransferase HpnI n=1 Tax=Trichlorobacter sp. TaxID=2911007 RepID=UPI00255F96E3|nr:bacteriohopanetetrol glucosamine biosynthesis glycosyltransferase HpnI [Trichlorobacter sp.]MDK9717934.1 bacteriohopanetetrol glucosamine biosynthesis glycosyltransferase HpnI [Trichlorobacter sp.]
MPSSLLPFLAVLPASIYSLLTLWCGWLFFKEQGAPDKRHDTAISILKPVKGMDEGSYENFASFCRQEYMAPLQLIFCVAAADDPAIKIIQQLMTVFPHHDICLNIDPTIHGPNYKVSNLINAFPKAKYDLLMICDSDIRVEPTFLQSVTAHFSASNIGLVTSPYRSSTVHGAITAFEALAFTSEMVPNVVTALKLEGLSFALGAAMTFRRQALQDIGGLKALVDYLADDYQLGNQIHRAGWQLKLDHQFVESMLKPESPTIIFSRQLRWARTMRVSRPGGYLASGITLPGLAIIAAFLTGPPLLALSAISLLYLTRLSVTSVFSRWYVRDNLLPAWAWLLPLRDLLAFGTWLLAFTGNRVNWRGHCFLISPNGKLKEL